jgi:hypothetical protein
LCGNVQGANSDVRALFRAWGTSCREAMSGGLRVGINGREDGADEGGAVSDEDAAASDEARGMIFELEAFIGAGAGIADAHGDMFDASSDAGGVLKTVGDDVRRL